jgi:ABC-type Fe3+-siderophore transport system permease subunit
MLYLLAYLLIAFNAAMVLGVNATLADAPRKAFYWLPLVALLWPLVLVFVIYLLAWGYKHDPVEEG